MFNLTLIVEAVFFTHLYRSYWKTLCQKLKANFGDGPPDPEDIAQQAFIKYSQHLAAESIENPQGYLYTLAKNLYIDQFRSQTRYDNLIDNIFSQLELDPIGTDSLEDIALQSEKLNVINRTLQSLSEKQRSIVKASRLDGETYQQIADRTGYSLSDVCRTLEAVNHRLKRAVNEWERGQTSCPKLGKK